MGWYHTDIGGMTMTNRERLLCSIESAWRKKQVRTILISWIAVLAGLLLISLFSALSAGGALGISIASPCGRGGAAQCPVYHRRIRR